MANKPLKSVQFPGLDDTYTIPQVDNTLAVTGAAADSKKVGDELTQLKADFTQLDGKIAATQITNTASGAIASFPDGADGVPVKDLVVDIEPVQNLHGQSNPYPAGGGKNLAEMDGNFPYNSSGITITKNSDGSITINGTATENVTFTLMTQRTVQNGQYTISGVPANSASGDLSVWARNEPNGANYARSYNGNNGTVNISTGTIYIYCTVASGATVNNVKAFIQLEAGATATAYAPYENICPISGWTGANVVRTGKNLLNKATMKVSTVRFAKFGVNQYSDSVPNKEYKLDAGTYVFSISGANSTLAESMAVHDESGARIGIAYNSKVLVFSVAKEGFFTFTTAIKSTDFVSWDNYDFQVEKGSVATDYEPYKGNTYSITFPTEAGTVYGGTLDVTTGVLTVTHGRVDLGTLNWVYSYGYFSTSKPTGCKAGDSAYVADIICEAYKSVSRSSQSDVTQANGTIALSPSYLFIIDSNYGEGDAASFKASLSGVYLVYPLATPQTYQLDPVTIATLLGQNHIWCDCGNVSVDYRADTKLYIENLTAPTEDDMVANTNIPDATYFMVGNTLYLSTTTIPAGDTINPGTNCTKMDLAAALNAINS